MLGDRQLDLFGGLTMSVYEVGEEGKMSFRLSQELQNRMRRLLPHGTLNRVVAVTLEDLCDSIESDPALLGNLYNRSVQPLPKPYIKLFPMNATEAVETVIKEEKEKANGPAE